MIDAARDHLELVKVERAVYRDECKATRMNLKNQFTIDGTCQPPAPGSQIPPLQNTMKMHYSFDMAQQVRSTCALY